MLSSSLISTAALFWIWRVAMAFRPLNTAPVLLILGIITAIAGAAKALTHHDARLVLAFSTVSQAGLALVALGSGTYTSERGFIAHLFTHALAKALLFLAVGALVEKTHSSRLGDIRQEVWRHPLVALSMVIGALSLIGIPLTAGGVSKYWIMSGSGNPLIELATWVITIGTALIMGRLLVPHHSLFAPKFNRVSVAEPDPQPWSGPEAPGSADERYLATGPARYPVRTAIAATLAVMVVLVLLAGMAGTNAMGAITGAYYGIPALSLAVKALQLVALISVVGMFISLAPRHRWWPQNSLAGLRETLARSLSLPDAFLAVAIFFAAVLIIAFLPGVL